MCFVCSKAGQTHQVGKSRHPGDDSGTPQVAAPRRWRSDAGGGRADDRTSAAVVVVVTGVLVVVRRGPDRRGGAKVPDGLPGVRGRGEPVRRPAGRRGRRHQEAANDTPGLVRGQDEVRRGGHGQHVAASAPTAPTAPPATARRQ